MNRLTAFALSVSLFLWVQPLGAFIAPSMEDAACGGNRAFHMCSTQFSPGPSAGLDRSTVQKTFLSSGSTAGVEKTGPSAGSGSGSGVFLEFCLKNDLREAAIRRAAQSELIFPPSFSFSPPGPVPKI